MVYLINRDGNVWMEFASSGEVFMYAENDINMRTKRNFNLRADNDVNIEAGQNVNIKAAKDHDGAAYVGEGEGAGGQVNIESKADTHILSNSNLFHYHRKAKCILAQQAQSTTQQMHYIIK